MKLPLIAISQRVDVIERSNGCTERRDALDQAWVRFLAEAGFWAVPIPNLVGAALNLLNTLPVCGLVFTGGNDLSAYNGDAPERDATEISLLAVARARRIPVIGVCRGMQLLQHSYGVALEPLEGHVAANQIVQTILGARAVNSFHNWGTRTSVPDLIPWASADDGVVKAVRHATEHLIGVMWHPERIAPFDEEDLDLFRSVFAEHQELAA